jgi:hypothetical protein
MELLYNGLWALFFIGFIDVFPQKGYLNSFYLILNINIYIWCETFIKTNRI